MTTALIQALADLAGQSPQLAPVCERFIRFAGSSSDVFQRWHPPGHFTGSAFVVSADGQRTLLTHHRKLGRWLQPGGHADGEVDLAAVALREAQEETGVAGLELLSTDIFDVDLHGIPARGSEPDHLHYDVRHVVRAGADERFVVSAESHDLAWVPITSLLGEDTEESLRRMAQRWLLRV